MDLNRPDSSVTQKADWQRSTVILVAILLLCVAWIIYRPERVRPISLLDFSEFIPRLTAESNVADRFLAVVDYYWTQGRLNLVSFGLLALKWSAFEWWSPGWQIMRAGIMITLFVLTYLLLRRLGASRLGSVMGGSVYLWSPPAIEGWVRLTMGEPLGAALSLAMALRMTRFQATAHWKREIAIAAIGTVAIIWTKELLAPAILLPLVLGLTVREDGTFARPALNRRNSSLLLAVAGAAIVALVPVAFVYATATDSAYASLYGRSVQFIPALLAYWVAALIPFRVFISPTNSFWAAALIAFLLIALRGWGVALTAPGLRDHARYLLGIALLVPTAGIVVYLPNPWYVSFYSIPYLFGAAVLIGMAATWLIAKEVLSIRIVVGGWMFILAYGAVSAAPYAARAEAYQWRDERIISYVDDSVNVDSVWFASERPPTEEWLGFGPAMGRIAAARGRSWPAVRKVSCKDLDVESPNERPLTIDLDGSCEVAGDVTISHYYRRLDLRSLRVVRDSSYAIVRRPTSTQ